MPIIALAGRERGPGPAMRIFSHQELEALARDAGLPHESLDIAAAVAQAESAGGEARGHPTLDPSARKDSNGRWSIGLWQINSLKGPPPGTGRGELTNDQLAVASFNARAMAEISSRGTNWKPWGAFINGSFRKFLTREAGAAGPQGAVPFPGTILKKGSKGGEVCVVQERLRVLGHGIDRVAGCPFGPQTEAAVIAFQTQRGLSADGRVGVNTWTALFG